LVNDDNDGISYLVLSTTGSKCSMNFAFANFRHNLVIDNDTNWIVFVWNVMYQGRSFWILSRVRFSVKITSWWHYFFSIMWM